MILRYFTLTCMVVAIVPMLICCKRSSLQQQANTADIRAAVDPPQARTINFHQSQVDWTPYGHDVPIDVVNVTRVEKGPAKGDLRIEIKNISQKPIKFALVPLLPPECPNFAMHAGMIAGLGDDPSLTKPVNPLLLPGRTDVLVVKQATLAKFLRPKDYEGCSPEESYSHVFLSHVIFADGTEWRPPTDPTLPFAP